MRDITLTLHEDHKAIQRLLQKLTWEMDKHRWRELVEEVTKRVKIHMEAEEEAVYSRLAAHPDYAFVAKHSTQEHGEILKCVEALQAAEPDSTAAIENFAGLRYLFIEHVSEEEEALFPLISQEFDDEQMDEMFHDYCDAKTRLRNEWSAENSTPRRASGASS